MELKVFRKNFVKQLNLICAILLVWLVSITEITAQGTSFELWPETDVWYKVTPTLRFSTFTAITRYLESDTRDLNVTLQSDYSFGYSKRFFYTKLADQNRAQALKVWMIRGGYMGGWSLYDNAENYTEDMLFIEMHRRILLKRQLLFSQRTRMDNRWVGQDPVYSYRFRYRVMLEKEFLKGKTSIIPYINVEPFWDSRYDLFNRVRVIGGTTVSWKTRFSFEGNITYQYDSKMSSPNTLAFNAILHLYFETARVRENAGKK
ncbi:MAG TPA: DUF2490 domain-containing protein [Draconibacterium sp.]|nr:DUF2490 domain-containing protein [Draconibacterium sp.]